jgi:hypothetical protein
MMWNVTISPVCLKYRYGMVRSKISCILRRGHGRRSGNEPLRSWTGTFLDCGLSRMGKYRLPHSFRSSSVYKYEAMPAFPKRQVVNLGDQPQPVA